MEFNNIKELIEIFNKNGLTFLELEEQNFKIKLKKDNNYINIDNTTTNIAENITKNANTDTKCDMKEITSPLVGVFYTAKSPQDKPFVSVGDFVKQGDIIGLIESMKMMTEIRSEFSGKIANILVSNEELVEYNQVLIQIEE